MHAQNSGRFQGKVAVVTGGGAGIGAASCRRLSSEGARVVVSDIDQAAAERVAQGLHDALAVQVRLKSPSMSRSVVTTAVESLQARSAGRCGRRRTGRSTGCQCCGMG